MLHSFFIFSWSFVITSIATHYYFRSRTLEKTIELRERIADEYKALAIDEAVFRQELVGRAEVFREVIDASLKISRAMVVSEGEIGYAKVGLDDMRALSAAIENYARHETDAYRGLRARLSLEHDSWKTELEQKEESL